jgi:hypothetical protein
MGTSDKSAEDPLDHRLETMQKVLTGQMSPIERRIELVGRRRSLAFGAVTALFDSQLPSDEEVEAGSEKQDKQGESEFDTAENVKIEVESSDSDKIRLANFLAEKHSDAETIAVVDPDTIEVRGAPGGTFSVNVSEALESESDESREAESVVSPTPSMGAAAKQGGFN